MSTTKTTGIGVKSIGIAAVYLYVVLSGLIIAVNSAKGSDYLGILFGAASVLVVVVLHRMLKR